MSHAHAPLRTHCQNCGTELKGPYCHACGQHDFDAHQSFGHAAHEVLESFFHWDGKFFGGLFDLLFRPGYLTAEYNAGRRARHIPPLRLYIFVSLLFFIAPSAQDATGSGAAELDGETRKELVKGLEKERHNRKEPKERAVLERIGEVTEHSDQVVENFHHYLPRAVLVCLPFFALLSMLVFRRAGFSFLQHLVLALHLHAFFFLFSLAVGGWRQIIGLFSPFLSGWLYFIACVYLVVYAYLALRRVFGGGSGRRLVAKGVILLGSYACVVGLVMLGTIVIAALQA